MRLTALQCPRPHGRGYEEGANAETTTIWMHVIRGIHSTAESPLDEL